jgi:hypothetical protein
MHVAAQLVAWLNVVANALGMALTPIGVLPGWLSVTIVAAVTGVLLLLVFKYTSNQEGIKVVRDDIKANLLALKLFKDSARVAVRAQGRLLIGAVKLFVLALVPVAVMTIPVTFFLSQMALWYQQRPLGIGEDAVVTLQLNGDPAVPMPEVRLQPLPAAEVLIGPVRVQSKREVCWNLKIREAGYHRLSFQVGDQAVEKELAAGSGFMKTSPERPGWDWYDLLMNPLEKPFPLDGPVRSIAIDYPERSSWTSGTDYWVIYWFFVSFVTAFCFRRVFNVNV